MTQLKTSEDIPLAASHVSVIRIRRGAPIVYAKGKGEKQGLIADRKPSDKFLAAWTGQWSTDIFEVDFKALKAAFA